MEKIYLACDHGGFDKKEFIKEYLKRTFEVVDLGTDSEASVDYPDFGQKIAKAILSDPGSRGIALCGSGIGISISINRFKGVRAALCRSVEDARLSRLHNNANVICFGGRFSCESDIQAMIEKWLDTEFEGDRHIRRIEKLDMV